MIPLTSSALGGRAPTAGSGPALPFYKISLNPRVWASATPRAGCGTARARPWVAGVPASRTARARGWTWPTLLVGRGSVGNAPLRSEEKKRGIEATRASEAPSVQADRERYSRTDSMRANATSLRQTDSTRARPRRSDSSATSLHGRTVTPAARRRRCASVPPTRRAGCRGSPPRRWTQLSGLSGGAYGR